MTTILLEPMFARHETFAPRFAWFKKTYDQVLETPEVFSAHDATLRLGVGKNMVRSMRFWAGATELVRPRRPTRAERLQVTELARVLLSDDGWDPYLELPATAWLVHWRLFASGCHLPVWWYAFNDYRQSDFTVPTLAAEATRAIPALYNLREPVLNSVRRDVECLTHTYVRRTGNDLAPEDAFACPFRILGLIEAEPDRNGVYRFRNGAKANLPPEILLFAALDFAAGHRTTARSISIGRLTRGSGSPGRVFQLDEDSLLESLDGATRKIEGVRVTATAGVNALIFHGDAASLAVNVLNSYYSAVSGSTRRLTSLPGEPELFRSPVLTHDKRRSRTTKPNSPHRGRKNNRSR